MKYQYIISWIENDKTKGVKIFSAKSDLPMFIAKQKVKDGAQEVNITISSTANPDAFEDEDLECIDCEE